MASTLKYDGVFTLQIKGDGPVNLIVADVFGTKDPGESPGGRVVRGYARYNAAPALRMATDPYMPPLALLGKGWLAFTVDQGTDCERYQGIVALTGTTLADCIEHYFHQSDQLPTGIQLAVASDGECWRGSALLLQILPSGNENGDGDNKDDWRRAQALLATVGPSELLDSGLADADLLYRLFHEDGVRVFAPLKLRHGCRCSRDRVEAMMSTLSPSEIKSLREDGDIQVNCEFCNTTYIFSDAMG